MPGDSEHSDSPQRRSHQTNGDPSGGSALYWGGQPVAYDPQYYDRAHAASPYNHNMALHPASYGQNFSFTAAALGATSSNASSSLGMSVSPPHWVPGNAPWATSGSYVGSMGALGTSFGREREREIEAKYVRDFTCCGRQLNGLHELLEHYEEDHPNLPPDARMAALNAAQAVGPNRNSFETPAPAYAPNVINPPYQSSHGEVPTPPGMMDIEMDETAVQGPSSGNQFALRQAYAQPQYPAKGQKYSSAPSSPWSTAFRPPPNMMAPSQCLPPSLLSFNGPSQNYPATSQQHGQAQPQPQPQSQPQQLPHLQQQQQQQQQDPSFRPIKKQQKRIATPYEDASDAESERRFVCPFEGCGKVYKQANGLKYHLTRSINSTHGTLPPGTTLPVYPMEKLHGDQ